MLGTLRRREVIVENDLEKISGLFKIAILSSGQEINDGLHLFPLIIKLFFFLHFLHLHCPSHSHIHACQVTLSKHCSAYSACREGAALCPENIQRQLT